jgi:hypothetical protein
VIGIFGMGMGGRKQAWLRNRYICERIRQWQFQYICRHATVIAQASGSAGDEQQFVKSRGIAFSVFQTNHVKNVDARLHSFEPDAKDPDELIELMPETENASPTSLPSQGPAVSALDELFRAYRAIRFEGQLSYAQEFLGIGALKRHPKRQLQEIERWNFPLLLLVLALHALVVVGALVGPPLLKSPFVYFLALSATLLTLTLRVLEDGLRPHEHVHRMEDYLARVKEARHSFDTAIQKQDRRLALEHMLSLERAASAELLSFGRTARAAGFVI